MTTSTIEYHAGSFTSAFDVTIEMIGPDTAETYLETNHSNRSPKLHKIRTYARDMQAGNWEFNGETIKFDADGALIDGQNRLAAITKAGVALPFLVVRGLRRIAQDTVDTGSARTFGDALKMRGHSNYSQKAAGTTLLNRYLTAEFRDNRSGKGHTTTCPSIAELFSIFEAHPWIEDEAQEWIRLARNTPLTPALACVAWGVLSRIDAEDAAYFFDRMGTDVGHEQGEPILALRRAMANHVGPANTVLARVLLAYVFKAWNKFRSGERADYISYRQGGASPEAFPVPA
jgi:hypothetical protein